MKGIGKRVTIGFLSIVLLMLASGIISMFELGNLSNDTEVILATSRRNLELAKDMLKSAHEHSRAMTHIALFVVALSQILRVSLPQRVARRSILRSWIRCLSAFQILGRYQRSLCIHQSIFRKIHLSLHRL